MDYWTELAYRNAYNQGIASKRETVRDMVEEGIPEAEAQRIVAAW